MNRVGPTNNTCPCKTDFLESGSDKFCCHYTCAKCSNVNQCESCDSANTHRKTTPESNG